MRTIYAVFFDMESDIPDAYVLDEGVARLLIASNAVGDYLTIEVNDAEWMQMLLGTKLESWHIYRERKEQ